MSTDYTKLAELTAPEILLLSTLSGGGIFAGMRYLSDLSNKLNPRQVPKNKIQLELPDPLNAQNNMSAQSTAPAITDGMPGINKAGAWWTNPLSAAAGLPIGFMGSKALYDHFQEIENNKKIEQAKKQYTDQLLLAQQMNKAGGETPLVDQFCEAAAAELEKDAGWLNSLAERIGKRPGRSLFNLGAAGGTAAYLGLGDRSGESIGYHLPRLSGMSKPSVGNSYQDIMNIIPKDKEFKQHIENKLKSQGTGAALDLVNETSGHTAGGVFDIWKGLAGGGLLGTLGVLMHHHNKKKEKEQKAVYPTGVEYA